MQETRWPVIIFSRITAFGECFDVFPVSELPKSASAYFDSRDSSVGTVFLLPSIEYDFAVRSFRPDGTEARCGAASAMAAAIFLLSVRGLPLDELECETPFGIYKIISQENDGKFEILLPKCKLLYSNKAICISNTQINVSAVKAIFGTVRIVECGNAYSFEPQALRSVALSENGENIRGAAAYSHNGDTAVVRGYTLEKGVESASLAISTAVASRLFTKGLDFCRIISEGCVFEYRLRGDELAVSSQNPEALTFNAPDIII